jgi:hypothetical protein
MTITEIWQQAKTLSAQERKELAILLVGSLDITHIQLEKPSQHWGQHLQPHSG